uniref:Uncharacterized protein n=1 Tax=Solanum tuberosum TaxID=4113 RepID=M1BEH0_SOLTU
MAALSASAHVSIRTFFHSSFTNNKISNFSQQFKLENYTTITTTSKRSISIPALAPKTTENSASQLQSTTNSVKGKHKNTPSISEIKKIGFRPREIYRK